MEIVLDYPLIKCMLPEHKEMRIVFKRMYMLIIHDYYFVFEYQRYNYLNKSVSPWGHHCPSSQCQSTNMYSWI